MNGRRAFTWCFLFMGIMAMCAGCMTTGPTVEQSAKFQKAVDAVFQKWIDTNVNPDLEGFMTIWDEKAIKMAAGKAPVVGAAAIRQMKEKAFGVVVYDKFEIKPEEYQLAGADFGWSRGTYAIYMHPKAGGDPSSDIGTFVTLFHKQPDGTWRVYRDTMMPLPAK